MKQRYILMEFDSVVDGYCEIESHNVSNHKGVFEIVKQAKRRCQELQRENPERKYAYMIINRQGEIQHKAEFADD